MHRGYCFGYGFITSGLSYGLFMIYLYIYDLHYRWSLIAGRIPGRTDNEIKNYWNTHLSKKLISQGIDPRTHKPLNTTNSSLVQEDCDHDSNNKKLSSSKFTTTHNPTIFHPNPNHNDIVSVTPSVELEEPVFISGNRIPVINNNKGNGYYLAPNPNPNFQSLDISGLGLRSSSSNNGVGTNEEDDEINNCTDDVFSSFLNSLINEDVFNTTTQHQLVQQQQQLNGVVPCATSDPLIISPPPNFTFGAGWDIAPIMSSGSSFNQNDHPKRFHDHVEKKFCK